MGTLDRLGISTNPQSDTQTGGRIAILQGLAATVLLTSCLNLANMMLAFGSARQKEIAIRLAVGGARSRIVRQLLVQGLMLSFAGGALGLLAATWAAKLLVSSLATVLPITLALDLTPDKTVMFATLIFCTLATVAFGLWPALRLSRPDLLTSLKDQAGEGQRHVRAASPFAARSSPRSSHCRWHCSSQRTVRPRRCRGRIRESGLRSSSRWSYRRSTDAGRLRRAQGREAHRAVLERLRSTPASSRRGGIDLCRSATTRSAPRCSAKATAQERGPDVAGRSLRVLDYVITADYFRTLGLRMLRAVNSRRRKKPARAARRR